MAGVKAEEYQCANPLCAYTRDFAAEKDHCGDPVCPYQAYRRRHEKTAGLYGEAGPSDVGGFDPFDLKF